MDNSMDIPSIGFGTYRLGKDTEQSVIHAIKTGYRHLDTAPLYKNEADVGRAIANSGIDRKKLFVVTKISRDQLKKNEIESSIGNSLNTMGLDYVDLILLHEPMDEETNVANWQSLVEFQSANKHKVLNIGVSNFDQIDLNPIIKIQTPSVNQIEVNPFIQQKELVQFCKNSGIKVVAHTPLAKGEKFNSQNLNLVAESYNLTAAQLMLKWLNQNGIVSIPRSKNPSHIESNLGFVSQSGQSEFTDFNSCSQISNDDLDIMKGLDCEYATHPKYLRKNRKN